MKAIFQPKSIIRNVIFLSVCFFLLSSKAVSLIEINNLLVPNVDMYYNSFNILLDKENVSFESKYYDYSNEGEKLTFFLKHDQAICLTIEVMGENNYFTHTQLSLQNPSLELNLSKNLFSEGVAYIVVRPTHLLDPYSKPHTKYLKLHLY